MKGHAIEIFKYENIIYFYWEDYATNILGYDIKDRNLKSKFSSKINTSLKKFEKNGISNLVKFQIVYQNEDDRDEKYVSLFLCTREVEKQRGKANGIRLEFLDELFTTLLQLQAEVLR